MFGVALQLTTESLRDRSGRRLGFHFEKGCIFNSYSDGTLDLNKCLELQILTLEQSDTLAMITMALGPHVYGEFHLKNILRC